MARDARTSASERSWTLGVERDRPEVARVVLAGAWRNEDGLPDAEEVWREIEAGAPVRRLAFDASGVTRWDSGLVTFAAHVLEGTASRGIEGDRAGLPDGVRRLLTLAEAVPERQTGRGTEKAPWSGRV